MEDSGPNPFHYGSPASGAYFADREEELADVVDRMLNGQNVILLSPRRYGKTSLLVEAMERVRSRRGRTGYASMLRCTSARDVAETLLSAVLNGPLSWISSQRERLGQLLSRVRLAPSLEYDATGSVRASLAPLTASIDWREVLADALRLLTAAEEGKRPVSLVLDEFQRVAEIDPNLPAVFKVMADDLQRVSLVFSGSKLHLMERLAVGPGAPLLGMGERLSLGRIPEPGMIAFLLSRARDGGKTMDENVAATIYRAVDGVPNDVQRLAYEAFFLAAHQIDAATIELAIQRVVSHRAIDYEESFTRLAPVQQRVLLALARAPRARLYSRVFLEEVDVANSNAVSKAMAVLSDLELVSRQGREWGVADAFFRSWLNSQAP